MNKGWYAIKRSKKERKKEKKKKERKTNNNLQIVCLQIMYTKRKQDLVLNNLLELIFCKKTT